MRYLTIPAALLLLGLTLSPTAVYAEAASGFGIYLTTASIKTKDAATEQEYADATYGGGFDYQQALGRHFSLGVAVDELVGEAAFPTLPSVDGHKFSTIGLEARIWMGSAFVGYHQGTYIFVTGEGFGSPEFSGGTSGGGLTVGIEGEGGWFVVAQSVKVEDIRVKNGPLVDSEGYRVRLGYRWR